MFAHEEVYNATSALVDDGDVLNDVNFPPIAEREGHRFMIEAPLYCQYLALREVRAAMDCSVRRCKFPEYPE